MVTELRHLSFLLQSECCQLWKGLLVPRYVLTTLETGLVLSTE